MAHSIAFLSFQMGTMLQEKASTLFKVALRVYNVDACIYFMCQTYVNYVNISNVELFIMRESYYGLSPTKSYCLSNSLLYNDYITTMPSMFWEHFLAFCSYIAPPVSLNPKLIIFIIMLLITYIELLD